MFRILLNFYDFLFLSFYYLFKGKGSMEIEVIRETKLELEMIVHGENHSLCNVLRKYLMEDEDVEYAVYGIDHPLTGEPIMSIKTKRSHRPRDSLLKAAQRLKEETAEFKDLIDDIEETGIEQTETGMELND